jgi:large subunit ribosomal protein L35
VPDDPDILTTQPPSLNPLPEETETSLKQSEGQKAFPRLQYRPPPLGVNAAYDAALQLIAEERNVTQKKLYQATAKLKRLADGDDAHVKARRGAIQQQIKELKIQLDLDDPEVRWRVRHGDYDLTRPVYRFLAEEAWRGKPLALLKQRVEQMHVTPDLIPLISPEVDVSLAMQDRTSDKIIRPEPGAFVKSRHASTLPQVSIQSFKEEPRRLVMAIVDADVPDVATDSFTTRLHYLRTDITVDPSSPAISKDNGTVLQEWIPPHPEKGTPYHRLCVLVWELPERPPQPTAPLASKVPGAIPRLGFKPQHYAQQNGLHAAGVTFWRQLWDVELAEVMAEYPQAKYKDIAYRPIKA